MKRKFSKDDLQAIFNIVVTLLILVLCALIKSSVTNNVTLTICYIIIGVWIIWTVRSAMVINKKSKCVDLNYKPDNIKSYLYHKRHFSNKIFEDNDDIVSAYINNAISNQYDYEQETNRVSFSCIDVFHNYIGKEIDGDNYFFNHSFYRNPSNKLYYAVYQDNLFEYSLTIHFNDQFIINNIHVDFCRYDLTDINSIKYKIDSCCKVLDVIIKK